MDIIENRCCHILLHNPHTQTYGNIHTYIYRCSVYGLNLSICINACVYLYVYILLYIWVCVYICMYVHLFLGWHTNRFFAHSSHVDVDVNIAAISYLQLFTLCQTNNHTCTYTYSDSVWVCWVARTNQRATVKRWKANRWHTLNLICANKKAQAHTYTYARCLDSCSEKQQKAHIHTRRLTDDNEPLLYVNVCMSVCCLMMIKMPSLVVGCVNSSAWRWEAEPTSHTLSRSFLLSRFLLLILSSFLAYIYIYLCVYMCTYR